MMHCRWPRRVRQWGTPHSSSLFSICRVSVRNITAKEQVRHSVHFQMFTERAMARRNKSENEPGREKKDQKALSIFIQPQRRMWVCARGQPCADWPGCICQPRATEYGHLSTGTSWGRTGGSLGLCGLHGSTWVVRVVSGPPGPGTAPWEAHPPHMAVSSCLNSRSRMPTDPTCRGGARLQHLSREPGQARVLRHLGCSHFLVQSSSSFPTSPSLAQAAFTRHTNGRRPEGEAGLVPGWYSRSCRRAGAARAL